MDEGENGAAEAAHARGVGATTRRQLEANSASNQRERAEAAAAATAAGAGAGEDAAMGGEGGVSGDP